MIFLFSVFNKVEVYEGLTGKKGKRQAPWMARSERTRMCQRLSALPVIPLPESERRWFDVLFFSAHSEYSEDLTGKKKKA
ncbi:hypothetical protein [Morganella morganii]|uniref:hypothetical protein n=1 Tax=Morganella morganii TaxID=582 RepID=UPI0011C03296|nr:hypothetical protein [Morganella morganii]